MDLQTAQLANSTTLFVARVAALACFAIAGLLMVTALDLPLGGLLASAP